MNNEYQVIIFIPEIFHACNDTFLYNDIVQGGFMAELKGDRSHSHLWGIRVGTEIAASMLIGLGAGYLLDRWLDTRPLLLMLFGLFGMLAGFANLYHVMGLDRYKQEGDGDGRV